MDKYFCEVNEQWPGIVTVWREFHSFYSWCLLYTILLMFYIFDNPSLYTSSAWVWLLCLCFHLCYCWDDLLPNILYFSSNFPNIFTPPQNRPSTSCSAIILWPVFIVSYMTFYWSACISVLIFLLKCQARLTALKLTMSCFLPKVYIKMLWSSSPLHLVMCLYWMAHCSIQSAMKHHTRVWTLYFTLMVNSHRF